MKFLIKVIFKAVKLLITLITAPLDLLIKGLLPDISHGLSQVASFFDWLTDFVGYVLSWLPFTSSFYVFLIACLVFYYTIPLVAHTIKLIVAWYNALKP